MIKRIIRGAKGHPGTGVLILYVLGGTVMFVMAVLPWL